MYALKRKVSYSNYVRGGGPEKRNLHQTLYKIQKHKCSVCNCSDRSDEDCFPNAITEVGTGRWIF